MPASAQDPGYTLAITGGDNQSACRGAAFADPLQVTVTDASLAPVAGVQVTFTGPASGASIVPASFTATTGADGVASFTATADASIGRPAIVASIEGGASVTFNLQNSVCRAPFWMPDPLDPGQPAPDPATPPDTAVPGYWWRDTTNQNVIAQHSEDQFTAMVYQPYASSKLKLMVYVSATGANSTALVGPNSFWLVGPGGGKDEANYGQDGLPGFLSDVLH